MAFNTLPGMQTAHPAWMIAFKHVTSHLQVFESVQQVFQAHDGTLRATGEASHRTLMGKDMAVGENETPLINSRVRPSICIVHS